MTFRELSQADSLTAFLERIENFGFPWIAKRLSGNDTGLTNSHQAGVYWPAEFFRHVFPEICTIYHRNPDLYLPEVRILNTGYTHESLRIVYYNNRFFDGTGTRNEFRMTGWGGRQCPLQDSEKTGSIFIFSIAEDVDGAKKGVGWLCSSSTEEELFEDWIGLELYPGEFLGDIEYNLRRHTEHYMSFVRSLIEPPWQTMFPSGKDIFAKCEQAIPHSNDIDRILMKRRMLEYDLFLEIEKLHVLPIISKGFATVDDFIMQANSITNRRKSRTGRSLELHLEVIFKSEGLLFEVGVVTENRKKPDFLFPSQISYQDSLFPDCKLDMLGAKTCCKDRWRQILNEANRVPQKHLFTLQEGISENQMQEMTDNGVILVVPEGNRNFFPREFRNTLLNLRGFINMRLAKQRP